MIAPSSDYLDYPLVVAILLKKLGGSVLITEEEVANCDNCVISVRDDPVSFGKLLEVANRCSIQ